MTNDMDATSTVDHDVDIANLIDLGLIEMVWIDDGPAYRIAEAIGISANQGP